MPSIHYNEILNDYQELIIKLQRLKPDSNKDIERIEL